MTKRLSPSEIDQALAELNQALSQPWQIQHGKLHLAVRFPSFVAAFGFITQVALLAQSANHHPEWSNVYNKVVINLTTYDVRGLSALDFELAQAINALLEPRIH